MRNVKAIVRGLVFGPLTKLWGDDAERVNIPVLRGAARGIRLNVDLLKGGENAYWLGRYDVRILRRLQSLLRHGWVVWDIGTYIGFYSTFFARAVGLQGHVVAVEPDPENLSRTKNSVALNCLSNVTFVNAAVGAPRREMEFICSERSQSHLVDSYVGAERVQKHGGKTIRVRCMSLDEVLLESEAPPPALIKLDIEGAEGDALQHAERVVERAKPLILVELHNPDCDSAAWEFAREFGYGIQSMKTGQWIECKEDVNGTVLLVPKSSLALM